jgi:hypothetical protein
MRTLQFIDRPVKRLAFIAAVISAAAGPAQAATNLAVNGSFESGAFGIGSFDGWTTQLGDASTFVDSSGQTGPQPGKAEDGLWSAYFGSTAAAGGATIAQSIATTPGQTYALDFYLANDNGGGSAVNAFSAHVGGLSLFNAAQLPDGNYVHEHALFTATGASSVLSFTASNDRGYLQLDNVSVSAVPEPGSEVLALVGLLILGGQALRSRRS